MSGTLSKVLDLLVTPGEVFEKVVASPPRVANWLVPMVLVLLSSLWLLSVANTPARRTDAIGQLADAGQLTVEQIPIVTRHWSGVAKVATGVEIVAGTLWSAVVLWGMGRWLLKRRFSFVKTFELVALAGVILALGNVITALLILATGSPDARPGLSLLLLGAGLGPENPVRILFESMNLFYLWLATVLAIGLARLSGAGFKASAYWVFGYWVVGRLALGLLG